MKRREFLRKVGFAGVIAAAVSAGLSLPKELGLLGINRLSAQKLHLKL